MGGETSICKISTEGRGVGGRGGGGGQMSRLHFQLGGKCPLIDLLIGGANVLGAYVLESFAVCFEKEKKKISSIYCQDGAKG